MNQCQGTKGNGARCGATVEPPHTLCWWHDPANAEKRRRAASRGGKGKANQEIRTTKQEIRDVIARVHRGEIERNDAATIFQGYRTLLDYIKLERGVRVEDELAAEIEELKRERGHAS